MTSTNLARIERLTSQLKNIKAASAKGARIGMQQMLTSGGGLLAGIIDAKFSKIPNTNVDTAGVVGGLGVIAAMSGFFDDHSDNVGAASGGMLAYVLGREAKEYFLSR
jgi:hypothetical protein